MRYTFDMPNCRMLLVLRQPPEEHRRGGHHHRGPEAELRGPNQ